MKRSSAAFREAQRIRMVAWRASLSPEKKAEIHANQQRARQRPEAIARARETRRMRDLFRAESTAGDRRAYQRKYYANNKDRFRGYAFRKKYGISFEDYQRMADEQGGLCLICHTAPNDKLLHLDHCHSTGRVRGLLCAECNSGLGMYRDSPERLEQAAAYLRERS